MLSSGGPTAFSTDNLPWSDLRCHKTNHLGLCNFQACYWEKTSNIIRCWKISTAYKWSWRCRQCWFVSRANPLAACRVGVCKWHQHSMWWTAPGPGPVNHKVIYVKQGNKLCVLWSISHPLSASKELQQSSTPYTGLSTAQRSHMYLDVAR